MGKQQGLYKESGQSNILYYSWKGIPYKRIVPEEVYQTPVGVPKNANGLSTVMGGSFRKLLAEVIPYPQNRQMQTAVRLALLKWIKRGPVPSQPPAAIPFISKISLNEESVLPNCLRVPLTVSFEMQNELAVFIPLIKPTTSFIAPSQTNHIQLKIAAASCNLKTGEAIQNRTHHMIIPYNAENIISQKIPMPLQMPTGSVTIIAAALDYYCVNNGYASLIENARFRPAEVIGGVVRID